MGCMSLVSCPFLLGCQICWHIIVHSILLWVFVHLCSICWFLLFHFLFCIFGFSLSLWCVWPEVCQFCLPFHRISSWFYWFFKLSFESVSLISSLIFMISFLLLTLGFVCSSFSNSFRWWVKLLIWDFSSFLRKACIATNFPLSTAFAASHRFWVVVSSLSFVSRCFLISFLTSSLAHGFFSSMLFSFHATMSSHLWWSMIMWENRMYTCMCNWVTMLYSRKKKQFYWGNNNSKKFLKKP